MLEFLAVLRRRWRVVVALVALGVAASSVLTMQMAPSYRADAQLFVAFANSQGVDSAGSLNLGSIFTSRHVVSYPDLVTSPRVLKPVVRELGLDTTSAELADEVAAQVPPNTSVVEVYADAESPERAAEIANAVARNLTAVVQDLDGVGGGQSAVRVTITREAVAPASPTSPVPAINIVAGLVAGLAVGILGALLRESLDNKITDEASVESATGLATLAAVPLNPDVDATPVLTRGVASPTWSEPFHTLRTTLGYLSPDAPLRVLLVASPDRGDGKTVTAANLAASLAQAGRRIVLLDADLRRPGQAKLLGLVPDVGVTTAVVEKATATEVTQRAHGIDVITSGPVPPNPSELVESEAFRSLVRSLRRDYDMVVIDSPPLAAVTDAAVASRVADAVILVCRSGGTRLSTLRAALAGLTSVDARVAGVVLNGVESRGTAYYQRSYRH